ncbi:MAG: hypothetical protein AABY15_09220 [Nanoarchaeota archaeon]
MITKEQFTQLYGQAYLKSRYEELADLESRLRSFRDVSLEIKIALPESASIVDIINSAATEKAKIEGSDFRRLETVAANYEKLKKDTSIEERKASLFFDVFSSRNYDPKSRKISLHRTPNTRHSDNATRLTNVLKVCEAEFVEDIKDADTAIYWGKYLCDYAHGTETPLISELLWNIEKRDITGFLFFHAQSGYEYCYPHCWEPKSIKELKEKGEKIFEIPTGYGYVNTAPSTLH